MESDLKNILLEIQLIISDTSNQKISQREKITNYRKGSEKIKDAINYLEEIKKSVYLIDIRSDFNVNQHQKLVNVSNMIDFPGSNIDDLLNVITLLKQIFMQLNNPAEIIEHNEKDIIVDPNSVDIYIR